MTPRTIQRILKRIANKARITRPVSPHVLRHTFAVAAVQKGISLPALQRLLGHDRLTSLRCTPASRQKRATLKIDCYRYEPKYTAAGV
jgi:site-specific recombinase XerD